MKRHQIIHLLQSSKKAFVFGTLISLCFYAVIRIMFYEFSLPLTDELMNLVRTLLIGGLIISSGFVLFLSLEIFIKFLGRIRFRFSEASLIRIVAITILILSVFFAAAQPKQNSGTKKNAANGFTTNYNILVPGKAFLFMNGEELNHSDIPMGESFQVVNDKVIGYIEKNGKVSVGCSLIISDKNGKKILVIQDMYKGKDIFSLKDASKLTCTVPTKKLTGWEEKYDVVVTFWDKYGTGRIVNKVKIRMIDMP